jgi:GT2 family glycosyltransferase
MTEVSAIVVDIGRGPMLQACLRALERQGFAEIIVHDNTETNIGFAGGVNAAYARSRGEYIALVNNDAVLDSDWLDTVVCAMNDDPRLGAVQTIIRGEDGAIDGAGIDISDGTFRQIGHGQLPTANCQLPTAWGVSATAALYRRAAIGERVFDPAFFAYYEDVDLCARLHEGGWSTRVLPVIKATHRGSASLSVLGKDALRLKTRNRYWVARRHRGVGRIGALLWEDLKSGPSIARIRGVWEGLRT